jgi:hypothetical protein
LNMSVASQAYVVRGILAVGRVWRQLRSAWHSRPMFSMPERGR